MPIKTNRSLSLSHSLYLGLFPAALSLIIFLGVADYSAARHQTLIGIQREIDILAQDTADRLSAFFSHRREDAIDLGTAPLLKDYLKNIDYSLYQEAGTYRKELGRYFSQFADRSGVYSRISFYTPSGQELVAGTPTRPISTSDMPPQAPFPQLLAGEVKDTGISPGKTYSITYWISVLDDTGRWRGNIVLVCNLSSVIDLLNRMRVGNEGQAFLTDTLGREFFLPFRAPSNWLVADAPIAGSSWKVRLVAEPGEFLAPLRRVGQWMTLFTFAAACIFFWWIGFKIRDTVQPIEAMAEGTKKIAAGDLDFQFSPSPITELHTLGDSFNEMTRSLKERTHELEARIRELTSIREMEGSVIQRLDEETILRTCLKAVARGLSFDRTGLYWVDTQRQEIAGRYLYGAEEMGLTEETFQKRRIPLGTDDILNQVVRTRVSVLAKDPAHTPHLNLKYIEESKTEEFVMAPICGKDRVFGVLVADNYYGNRSLTESDKDGLTLFAHAAGLALENAALFQNLAESEARYRTVLENSPVAILGISGQQWISTWNHGAESIFGYQASEILGKPLRALFSEGTGDEFPKLLSAVIEKGAVRDYAITGVTKNGRQLDLNLSWGGALPDFWINKEWTIVIRDVTESKKLQQQLIRSEKLSAVGQLISGIAHELNNPLQAVVGYAQLLANGSRETFEEDLHLILDSAVRCRKIIDNLLVFVRQGKVEMKQVRLSQVLHASLNLLSYKLKKAQSVKVRLAIPKGLPQVNADAQQLQQVLVNLINNACDAMAGIQGAKELDISATALGPTVKIEVSDSGPGIPEEIKDRIFEPFFSTKPEGLGTGLGLAICRQILADHGGDIGCRNRPGGGAGFWIELPVASRKIASKQKSSPVPAPPGRQSILLVDDEVPVLGFLQRVLEADGNRVDTASSRRSAAAKTSRTPYDLVVTDVQLGDGSGFELYEHWSRHSNLPRPEFLFITGDVLNMDIQRTFQQKNLQLLHKPVDIEEFKRTAYTLLIDGKERAKSS